MAVLPTIDNIASALSLILTTIATLRAASRLEQRICNNGSIGLMDGPPILGPGVVIEQAVPRVGVVDPSSSLLDDEQGTSIVRDDNGQRAVEASPLWEHTEAFRRAVILGLVFEGSSSSDHDTLFSEITRNEGSSIHVRGGSDIGNDLAIAAAVDAGLLLPSSARGGSSAGAYRHNRRVRGGGKDSNSPSSSNPIGIMASWFVRELSAPLSAIPAWHGLLCSYLRDQKETKLRKSQWCLLTPYERIRFLCTGISSGKIYDPSGFDFDASISGTVHIPSRDQTANIARVKAFAPKTFRNLRNACFRVKEEEYARSILNAINGEMTGGSMSENGAGASIDMAGINHFSRNHDTISNVLQEVAGGGRKSRIRQKSQTSTLPYISFQSNSKGAARAGTFFFFTADGAYMIKTVKKEEAKAFLEMLPEYHRFMSDNVNGRNSLLTRIFGMYSVQFQSSNADAQHSSEETGGKWNGGLYSPSQEQASNNNLSDDERVYLVMHSVFPSEASAFVTERFDLKGSTVGRECSPEERSSKGANAVMKDLDLKREVDEELNEVNVGDRSSGPNGKKTSRFGICVGRQSKTSLMAQLERDVDLLHRCNVLDYSLLVGVADMEMSNGSVKPKASSKRVPQYLQNVFRWMDFPMPYYGAGMTKVDGGSLSSLRGTRKGKQVRYYLGVIDFLQPWGVKKRIERDLKGLAGYDTSAISCVAPADYADRFLKFANKVIS